MKKLIILLLCVVIVSACSNEEPISKQEKTLDDVWNEIPEYGKEIARKHSIEILQGITGFSQDAIILEVRRFGDFEKKLTNEEIEQFKRSFFKYAGQEYTLKIVELECCNQEASFIGEILEIDHEKKIVQIINSEGGGVKREVDWLLLSEDAKIILVENQELKRFSDLSVGQNIRAWSLKYINEHPVKDVVKIEILSN